MRLSASRLGTWMNCSLQAYFKYERSLPEPQNAAASFGTCVHHAIEHYNITRDAEAAVGLFLHVWANPNKLGVAPDIWPARTSYDHYRDRGIAAIRNYHDQCKWNKRTVLATEYGFLVPFGKHELTGFIDCLEITGGKTGQVLQITDYKTSAKAPYLGNLRQNIQFTVYDYASRQPEFWEGNGPDFPPLENGSYWKTFADDMTRRNVWYGLMQQREFDAGERSGADFMRLYRVADEIERALHHEVFVPDISGDSCGFCPYVGPCGLTIPPSEVEE